MRHLRTLLPLALVLTTSCATLEPARLQDFALGEQVAGISLRAVVHEDLRAVAERSVQFGKLGAWQSMRVRTQPQRVWMTLEELEGGELHRLDLFFADRAGKAEVFAAVGFPSFAGMAEDVAGRAESLALELREPIGFCAWLGEIRRTSRPHLYAAVMRGEAGSPVLHAVLRTEDEPALTGVLRAWLPVESVAEQAAQAVEARDWAGARKLLTLFSEPPAQLAAVAEAMERGVTADFAARFAQLEALWSAADGDGRLLLVRPLLRTLSLYRGLSTAPDAQRLSVADRTVGALRGGSSSSEALAKAVALRDSKARGRGSLAKLSDAELVALASAFDAAAGTDSRGEEHLALAPREKSRLTAVALRPDGAQVALAYASGAVLLFDGRTGAELLRLSHARPVLQLAFSTDALLALTAGELHQWALPAGRPRRAPIDLGAWQRAELSADGEVLLLLSAETSPRVVDLATAAILSPAGQLAGKKWTGAFNADGAKAIAAGTGSAVVWDRRSGALFGGLDLEGEDAVLAALSPDGARALVAGRRGTVRVVELAAPEHALQSLKVAGRSDAQGNVKLALAIDPRWRRVAHLADGRIRQSALHSRREQSAIEWEPPRGLQSFAYGASGELLYALGNRQLVVLGQGAREPLDRVAVAEHARDFVVSADGRSVLTWSESGAELHRLWPAVERRPAEDRRAIVARIRALNDTSAVLDAGRRDGVRRGDKVLDARGYPMWIESVDETSSRAVRGEDAPQTARDGEGVLITGAQLMVRG